ncbi:MAG: glycosyltransferase family 2 protein [Calditrichia bacterium]
MNKQPSLSITIIGHNEAYHLKELLPTLKWAEEIIYVDCQSSDNSLQIAEEAGCKVFSRPNLSNLNVNKSFAMEQAGGNWIFYLDPDERITEALAEEIRIKIADADGYRAFSLNRRNHYFGSWLRYGSQYPDVQLRLFQKDYAYFPQKHVHEKLVVDGPVGKLKADLLHYPYLNISQYLQKFDFYTSFEARYLYDQGYRPGFRLAYRYWFSRPIFRFIRRFFLKGGFRDGWPGFFAALFDALNFMVRYFKLLELSRKNTRNP